jgi:single-stranded-DNA-specific exonuclease
MPPARWILPSAAEAEAAALAEALRIGLPAARVLCARGYSDAQAARAFLAPPFEALHDPFLMRDMDRAVARLRHALAGGEKILIYGDYDVDGTAAIVILRKAIELAGGEAEHFIPHRLRDGYGMHPEAIEAAASRGVKLIISVDTGIRAGDVVRLAGTLGIEVIVTDHHLPDSGLPPAVAVLNPNRPDCAYPDKDLCGAGVAFKLAQALLGSLNWPPEKLRRVTGSFLKVVALATVADVVPLTGENRIIAKHGLGGLGNVRNPGLRALLDVSGFNEGCAPTATQVAFRVAPRINAAGRMDTAMAVIEMFTTPDIGRARALAQQLHDWNAGRQQTETEIVEAVLADCERAPVTDAQSALVFCGPAWHRGVLGIVASRLVERFHRPVFVLSAENGTAQGSGRSIPQFHLLDALDSMGSLFLRYGGHAHAAGVTLAADLVPAFRQRFQLYAAERLSPADFVPQVEIDALVNFPELNDASVDQVLALAPFGCGNPAPLFAALNAEVVGPPTILKERHLRVVLKQNGRTLALKAWNFAERAGEFAPGARLDAALTLEEDAFSAARGYPAWCATLRDARPARAAATFVTRQEDSAA